MLGRLIQLIDDPPPAFVFEFSNDGIAWAAGETLGFQAFSGAVLRASPLEDNVLDAPALSAELRRLGPSTTSKKRRPCALILPDYCGRVTVLDFDSLPSNPKEQATLVRFRVKKSLPFDADSAALSFQAQTLPDGRQEVAVAAVSLEILSRYEAVLRDAGFHPGFVTVSSLASLELIEGSSGVTLAARMSGKVLTLSLLTNGVLRLARCVELSAASFEDASTVIFPTLAYAEDQFGTPVSSIRHCGFEVFPSGWESAFDVPLEPFRSPLKNPAGQDAGLLGYLKATRAA